MKGKEVLAVIDTVRKELRQLSDARKNMVSCMHYNTVDGIIEKSGLPYRLVQDVADTRSFRYTYRFITPDWDGPAALYIQETFAGRPHRSMREAMDTLGYVLNQYCRKMESVAFNGKLKGGS